MSRPIPTSTNSKTSPSQFSSEPSITASSSTSLGSSPHSALRLMCSRRYDAESNHDDEDQQLLSPHSVALQEQISKAKERHNSTQKASKLRLLRTNLHGYAASEETSRQPSHVEKRMMDRIKNGADFILEQQKQQYVPSLKTIEAIRKKKGFILDADGTLYVSTIDGKNKLIPGAKEFFEWVIEQEDKELLILTNSSKSTDVQLQEKFKTLMGVEVPLQNFINSAESTALFLSKQSPGAKCFVVGDEGLFYYLRKYGMDIVNKKKDTAECSADPYSAEYVVFGESRAYRYEDMALAINLVNTGSRFLATNEDVVDIDELGGLDPSTGSFCKIVETATGIKPYCLGKPNNLMMQFALKKLKCRREDAIMIGDRMDTDIRASLEAGLDNCLVLSGVTAYDKLHRFPYKPLHILRSLDDMVNFHPEENGREEEREIARE